MRQDMADVNLLTIEWMAIIPGLVSGRKLAVSDLTLLGRKPFDWALEGPWNPHGWSKSDQLPS